MTIHTAYGAEFRQDIIDVAPRASRRRCRSRKNLAFGHDEKRWITIAAERKESGASPAAESAEMREPKKWNCVLVQENETLRRAAAYLARTSTQIICRMHVLNGL
ncbi:transposase [Pseudarthrobacter sulfonivorans]|nr:transposase [Pseudarthrobacter sulfonivorans]